jgi:hypothetical protein
MLFAASALPLDVETAHPTIPETLTPPGVQPLWSTESLIRDGDNDDADR